MRSWNALSRRSCTDMSLPPGYELDARGQDFDWHGRRWPLRFLFIAGTREHATILVVVDAVVRQDSVRLLGSTCGFLNHLLETHHIAADCPFVYAVFMPEAREAKSAINSH